MPRLGLANPSILHGLLSLSAYYEVFLSRSKSTGSNYDNSSEQQMMALALNQYDTAVRGSIAHTSNDSCEDLFMSLASCVLLLSIEVLFVNQILPHLTNEILSLKVVRCQTASTITLLEHTSQLLDELDRNQACLAHHDRQSATESMRAFLGRLSYQACWVRTWIIKLTWCLVATMVKRRISQLILEQLGGDLNESVHSRAQNASSLCTWPIDDLLTFTSYLEAREYFFHISLHQYSMPIQLTMARFHAWSQAIDALAEADDSQFPPLEYKALKLYRAHLEVELNAHLHGQIDNPLIWDRYTAKFRAIIGLAIDMQDMVPDSTATMSLQMSIGTVAVLSCTAMRCRDPDIQRKALYVLDNRFVQEGLLASSYVAAVARSVVEVEERGRQVRSCHDIPKEARVVHILPNQKRRKVLPGLSNGLSWEPHEILSQLLISGCRTVQIKCQILRSFRFGTVRLSKPYLEYLLKHSTTIWMKECRGLHRGSRYTYICSYPACVCVRSISLNLQLYITAPMKKRLPLHRRSTAGNIKYYFRKWGDTHSLTQMQSVYLKDLPELVTMLMLACTPTKIKKATIGRGILDIDMAYWRRLVIISNQISGARGYSQLGRKYGEEI